MSVDLGASVVTVGGGGVTSASVVAAIESDPAAAAAAIAPFVADALTGGGWTTSTSGGASSAAVSGGTIALAVDTGTSYARAALTPPDGCACEVLLRISATTAAAAAQSVAVLFADAIGFTSYVGAIVTGSGTVSALRDGASTTPAAVTGILGGQGWLRVVMRGGLGLAYAGVGTSGALPTSWTSIGSVSRSDGIAWAKIVVQLYSTGDACTATVAALRTRAGVVL